MIEMIVAHDEGLGIGVHNELPWPHIREDMQHFRNLTSHKNVVMGRKTFESIGKPLMNRHNIVLTSEDPELDKYMGVEVVNSIDDIHQHGEFIVIGGAMLYKRFLDRVQVLHVTEVPGHYLVDTRFPEYKHMFELESSRSVETSVGVIKFNTYRRK